MATPRTVAFHTLGCKLNYAETSSVRRLFEQDGFTVVPYEQQADVYVLNTCSVTDNADRECRKSVRQALRHNPQAKIVVMGCYAQLKPAEIANIEGVDIVLGAAEKFQVLEYLRTMDGAHEKSTVHAGEIGLVNAFTPAYSLGDRTRSFLKVQDGCDYKCTFCTIPQARGRSRSASVQEIIQQAESIAQAGVKEIVLTGVNIGDFGKDAEGNRQSNFLDLIQSLDNVSGIERFRISSIEPNLCSADIIGFVASSRRFMPHFHMPLQSGNNEILARMRRRYPRELYADRVDIIRQMIPDACIGVDVICGFPGETDHHFEDTYAFIEQLAVDYLHVFTYSERDNTPAASMEGSVPLQQRKFRSHQLRQLSGLKKEAHYKRHVGDIRKVLFEKSAEEGYVSGFTDNYIRILMKASDAKVNTVDSATLISDISRDNELLMSAGLAFHGHTQMIQSDSHL